ncbi:MAG: ADP-ribosylglycohydrolase family protein [Myxococcota bacterium]|jgi:ADP-ribosylglycohydrolase|nr:ADP-ribosylglycohydrolase family protein [Myxococcota bacterium]
MRQPEDSIAIPKLLSAEHIARAEGLLLGQLVGDALGATVECETATVIRQLYPQGLREIVGGGPLFIKRGQITDDSELALALVRCLINYGPDFDMIARAYVRWRYSSPLDIGVLTSAALTVPEPDRITEAQLSAHAASVNGSPEKHGNGSMMRVCPWALYGAFLADHTLAALVRRDSALTHPAPAAQDACVAFVIAMAHGLRGAAPVQMYEQALQNVTEVGVRDALLRARSHAPRCDGAAHGNALVSIQNAFFHLLNTSSFEEGVVQTVMAGGDTDTNACITGALLGASQGSSAVPANWRDAVLLCTTQRAPEYQATDALELSHALLELGWQDAKSRDADAGELTAVGERADEFETDWLLLEKALQLALDAHRGQRDKAGCAYITHPLRLALKQDGPLNMSVALLHDVIEDSPHTAEQLEAQGFPIELVNAVVALSRKANESYEDFIERIACNRLAARIKLADLEDNLDIRRIDTLTAPDWERIQRYHKAHKRLSSLFRQHRS